MLFIGIVGGINDISFATGYISMVLAILSLSTISYDEANHGLKTLFTLPISKSDYVKEKYLFSLIITGIGFVFVTILGCFSKSGFMETLIILSTALLLLALSLPFQLKEGNEKGRIVLFVVVFGCTFLFAFLNQFIPKFFDSIESVLNTMDPTMFSVGLLIASIILYIISMMISIRIYNKKIVD
jgi:ABC-2 type transport system permease protein